MEKHSAFSNEIWLLKRLVRYEKWYPLLLVSLIAAKLLLPFLSTLLPAAAVAALTRGGGMGQYLAVIVGLMVFYAAGTFLRDWLENTNLLLRDNFRMEVCVAGVMEKAMTMDYNYLESPEGQRELAAAKNVASNPMSGGVNAMLCAVEPWLRSLLGILIYGTAAATLDWRILLVLAGMTAASYAAAALLQQYEWMTRKEQTQHYREVDYFLEQSENPANGKDIRLYRMEDWFLTTMRNVFRKRWKWMRGLVWRQMAGKLSDLLFLVLRDIVAYATLVAAFLSGRMDAAGFTFSLGVLAALTSLLNEFVHHHHLAH